MTFVLMKGNGLKIAIVAVCLVTAGALFYRNLFGQSDIPPEFRDQARTQLWYKCTKCGLDVPVPPEQLDKMKTKEVALPGDANPRLRMAPKKLQFIECPTCKDFTALFCGRCEKHQLVYFAYKLDGTRGKCEKCAAEAAGESGG